MKSKVNYKRLIALLLCALTVLSNITPVAYAWTSNEGSKASSEAGSYYKSIDGEYYHYPEKMEVIRYDEDGNTSYHWYNSGREKEKYLLKYNGETKEVFCIEVGVKFDESEDGYSSKSYKNSDYFSNLPTTAQYGIMLTTVYGYVDELPAALRGICNMDDFRFATQMIIWEYQQQLRTSPTNKADKNGIDKNKYYDTLKGRPAEKAYDWILEQMKNHQTIPSFAKNSEDSAKTYTLKYDSSTKKYTLKLTDENKTLVDIMFENNNDIKVSRSGNEYTITSSKMITNPVTISAQKDINKNTDKLLIWGRGGKQTMVTGAKDPVYFYLKINTETYGTMHLVKESEDGKIGGIKFTITGNDVYKQVTTDSKGVIDVTDLLPGTYTVTEESIDKYETQKSQQVTIKSGETSKVEFSNILKRGTLKVTKTSEDKLVEGVKFHLYGTALSGDKVDEYATTNASGIAEFKNILISTASGYTLEEVDTAIRYVIPKNQTAVIEWNKVTNKSVNNVLKKFRVTVTKKDSETGNIAQGDATLEGATYGIYDNGHLVDEYKTDKNGSFTTNYYICGDNWTIKEISASKGYLLNETVYKVGAEAKLYTIEYNATSNEVTEDVIKGKVSIIKHSDQGKTGIETPEDGAVFEIYLKSAGSYAKAKDTEKQTLTTNEDGFAETKLLPFGTYTVHQTKGWDERELVEDFDVIVSKHNKTYKYLLNNREFESYIKLVKQDAKTGKVVTLNNATFSLYKQNDNGTWEQVKCKVGKEYITTWTTDEKGIAYTENKLISGHYKVEELKVPYNFLQLDKELTFDVSMKNETVEYDDDYDAYITVLVKNEQPTATIKIDKKVALRKDVDTSLVDTSDLSSIKFRVTAKENIIDYADGSVIYEAGKIIGEYNLDKKGNLEVKELPLGVYEVEEIETLSNLVLDNTKHEVKFTYENETKKIYSETLDIENKTIIVEISKKDVTGEKEIEGAKLQLLDENKNIVDEWISTNKPHYIEGLNKNMIYYLFEDLSPLGYVKASTVEFVVKDTGDIQKVVMIDKVVDMSKVDVGGNEIEGATIQVIDKETDEIVDEWVSGKEPHKINNLEEGKDYILHEEIAKDGYVKATDIEFNVSYDKVNQHIEMVDKIVEMSKIDVGGNEIEGATIQVIDKETNEVVDEWVSGKEPHKIKNLEEGKDYILHEEICVDKFVKATDVEFTVSYDKVNQKLEMIDKVLIVSKTDLVTGDELEGAELEITDKETGEVIEKWTSSKEPHYVSGLEEGKTYILTEKTSPYGFEVAESIEFTVSYDKENQLVEMKDMPILKSIRVEKIDKDTGEHIKSNKFVFGIYEDKECTKLIKEVGANIFEGTALFEDLRYGTYYIKENKAPLGYSLSKQVVKIDINENGVFADGVSLEENEGIYSFEYYNTLLPIIQTGKEYTDQILFGIAVISSVIALAGIIILKKKNK